MAVRIADAAIVFSGITTPLARAAADARAHIAGVDKAAMSMGRGSAGSGYAASLKDQNRELMDHKKHLADIGKQRGSGLLGAAAKGAVAGATLGLGMAGIGGLASIGDAVVDSVKLASNFEQMKISFEVMLGSADKADAMLTNIKDFAAQSPLTFDSAATSVKQLVAYGVAADQAMPTLRALTDVASGTGVEMGRLTLAYGQVATAGRLYGTELRQFTEAGVPIIDALATAMGKPKEAIKNLVEEGKVGFPQVVQAFKVMTEGAGKFSGMTEKYGQSFAGQVEQLQDAVQVLKREFGGAIIKEMGLKDATKDMAAFAERVRGGIEDVKPAIRFVGDLAKAGAQVGNEFAKAAVVLAKVRLTGLLEDIPALKAMPEIVTAALADLQDFKIDRVKVATLGFALMDAMRGPVEMLQAEFGKILGSGEDFKKNLVDAAQSVKATADSILNVINEANRITHLRTVKGDEDRKRAAQMKAIDLRAPDRGFAMPPNLLPKEPDLDPYRPLKLSPLPQSVRPMDATADPVMGFAAPESRTAPPPWLTGAIRGDKTPDEIRAGTTPVKPAGKDLLSAIGFGPEARMDLLKTLAELDKKDAAGRADRGRDKALDSAAAKFEATASVLGAAFGSLKLAAADAKTELYKLKVPDQVIPRLRELSESLNKDLTAKINPIGDLEKHVGDINYMAKTSALVTDPQKDFDAMTGAAGGAFAGIAEIASLAKDKALKAAGPKLITEDMRALATMNAYKSATSGLDLSYRPPPTAEYGSKEFAKLETSAFTGTRNASVADTLAAMKKIAEDQLKEARVLARELGQELERHLGRPVNIPTQ